MTTAVKVYTALHGEAHGCIEATHEDETLSFRVGEERYRVPIPFVALGYSKLVLFDGWIPLDGLPKGASKVVDYDSATPSAAFVFGQKEVEWEENVSTVCAPDDYACETEYDERLNLPSIDEELVWVFVKRIFLLLSPGHSALIFRVKPRSLERQWMMVEAQKTGVIFRTINR